MGRGAAKDQGLTDKQWAFVREFVKSRSTAQAGLAAGYSKATARVQGSRLLTHPGVSAAITRLTVVAENRTGITVGYVLERLKTVAERCMQGEAVLDKEGNETGQWKFDSAGANRALELLGKHLRMFADRIEVDVTDALAERLTRARQRLTSMRGVVDAEYQSIAAEVSDAASAAIATIDPPNPSVASTDSKPIDNDLDGVLSIPD